MYRARTGYAKVLGDARSRVRDKVHFHGSAGLLWRLSRGAESPRAWDGLVDLNLAALLLATFGGFGTLFGYLVSSWVRGYCRMSIFIAFFSLQLGLLPTARVEGLTSYILPSLVLGLIYMGTIARLSRGAMLEVLLDQLCACNLIAFGSYLGSTMPVHRASPLLGRELDRPPVP